MNDTSSTKVASGLFSFFYHVQTNDKYKKMACDHLNEAMETFGLNEQQKQAIIKLQNEQMAGYDLLGAEFKKATGELTPQIW